MNIAKIKKMFKRLVKVKPLGLVSEDKVLSRTVLKPSHHLRVEPWKSESLKSSNLIDVFFGSLKEKDEHWERPCPKISERLAELFVGKEYAHHAFNISQVAKTKIDLVPEDLFKVTDSPYAWNGIQALSVCRKILETDTFFPSTTHGVALVIFKKNKGTYSAFIVKRNKKKRASVSEFSKDFIPQGVEIFWN